MGHFRFAWVVLVSAVGGLSACSVYDETLLKPDGSGASAGAGGSGAVSSGGAGAEGGTAVAGGTGGSSGGGFGGSGGVPVTDPFWYHDTDECETEGFPDDSHRPDTTGGDDIKNIYLGLGRIRFGSGADNKESTLDPEAWKGIGLDLDKTCSGDATCTAGGSPVENTSCENDQGLPTDGERCRDNRFGALMAQLAESPLAEPFGLTEPHFNCALLNNEIGLFLKITEFNGTLDDDQVRVDLYGTDGTVIRSDNPVCGMGGSPPPQDWEDNVPWIRSQLWSIRSRDLEDPMAVPEPGTFPGSIELPNSKYADANAYVRNGYLVAKLPDATELWLFGDFAHIPGLRLSMYDTTIVGRLFQKQDDTWNLDDATFGGLLRPEDLLLAFREIGACENMCDEYTKLTDFIDSNHDLLQSRENDPDADCDAISFGLDIEMREGIPGKLEALSLPTECPDDLPRGVPPHGCRCSESDPGSEPLCSEAGGTGGMGGMGGSGAAGTGGTGGTAGTGASGGVSTGGSGTGGSGTGGSAGAATGGAGGMSSGGVGGSSGIGGSSGTGGSGGVGGSSGAATGGTGGT